MNHPNIRHDFSGAARQVGARKGDIFGDHLGVLPRGELPAERIRRFRLILEDIAPWWLQEIEGRAEENGLYPEQLLDRACRPPRPAAPDIPGCTAVLAMGDRTGSGAPLLLKIRDERSRPQTAGMMSIRGVNRYIYGSDVENLGIAHFLNEKGLAGANNTGSRLTMDGHDPGLNDCHIARLVAETAGDCGEALEVIRRVIDRGYCGTAGHRRGMIFLFADTGGTGLVIENTPRRLVYRRVDRGVHAYTNHFLLPELEDSIDHARDASPAAVSSLIRHRRVRELINRAAGGQLSRRDLFRFSRDARNFPYSLCNGSNTFPWRTLSAFVHELTPDNPATWVCNGLPSECRYHPRRWTAAQPCAA